MISSEELAKQLVKELGEPNHYALVLSVLEYHSDQIHKSVTDYLLRKQVFCQNASKEVSGVPTVITVSAELWSRANTLMEARETILKRKHTTALVAKKPRAKKKAKR